MQPPSDRGLAGSDPQVTHQVPRQRQEAFRVVAAATLASPVIVACRNSTVAHQYRLGVRAAGGNVDNLRFLVIPKRGAA